VRFVEREQSVRARLDRGCGAQGRRARPRSARSRRTRRSRTPAGQAASASPPAIRRRERRRAYPRTSFRDVGDERGPACSRCPTLDESHRPPGAAAQRKTRLAPGAPTSAAATAEARSLSRQRNLKRPPSPASEARPAAGSEAARFPSVRPMASNPFAPEQTVQVAALGRQAKSARPTQSAPASIQRKRPPPRAGEFEERPHTEGRRSRTRPPSWPEGGGGRSVRGGWRLRYGQEHATIRVAATITCSSTRWHLELARAQTDTVVTPLGTGPPRGLARHRCALHSPVSRPRRPGTNAEGAAVDAARCP